MVNVGEVRIGGRIAGAIRQGEAARPQAVPALPGSMAPDSFARARRKILPPGPHLGTTYTRNAASSAGLSHAEAFALMHEMGIDVIRLGTYWDAIQPGGPGEFDFRELDEQLSLARQYGMKVILTVGMKAPGWPEGHIPGWAKPEELKADPPEGLIGKVDRFLADHLGLYRALRGDVRAPTNLAQDPQLRRHALAYIAGVVEHVAPDANILAFQVENEPGVAFGPDKEYVGLDFVQEEARLIKEIDPARRPLAVNVGVPPSKRDEALMRSPDFDIVGLDIYPKPGTRILGKERPASMGVDYRMNVSSVAARKLAEKHGKEVYVAEMQAEDWNPVNWTASMSMEHFHAQRRNGFEILMPWNVGHVFRTYRSGDRSHFEAWKRMASEMQQGVMPPPDTRSIRDRLADAWRHLTELVTGRDSGRI